MKLKIELETDDLREMILEHFRRNGFVVKNIDDICGKFESAYPDGLKVDADLVAVEPVQGEDSVAVTNNQPLSTVQFFGPVDTTPQPVTVVTTNTVEPPATPPSVLTITDLMDPTISNGFDRAKMLRDTKLEIDTILARSKALEQDKKQP